jgi:hypothetical protein
LIKTRRRLLKLFLNSLDTQLSYAQFDDTALINIIAWELLNISKLFDLTDTFMISGYTTEMGAVHELPP